MSTLRILLLIFLPLLTNAQETADTVSWFRIDGKTYYSRNAKGKHIPAVVEYKLGVPSTPALGYTHTVRVRDSVENVSLALSVGDGGTGQPIYFEKAGKQTSHIMAMVNIPLLPQNLDDDTSFSTDCNSQTQTVVVQSWKPYLQNKILTGNFQAELFRRVGLLNEYDCQIKYIVEGYFYARYAPVPERKRRTKE